MKRNRASADHALEALLLPQPRPGGHDVLAAGAGKEAGSMLDASVGRPRLPAPRRTLAAPAAQPRSQVLPRDVERRLADLAGVELPPAAEDDIGGGPVHAFAGSSIGEAEFAKRVLRVAELVTLGAFVLLVVAAVLASRFGHASLQVHELPVAGWGLAATIASLTLAVLAGDRYTAVLGPVRRGALAAGLMIGLLVAVTGVVANADGVAGPAWVLFLPVVLVAGAVAGPTLGLVIGAGAAAGVYAAAGFSDTLTVAGLGRLVVLLPTFPAVGWSAGALARLARDAAQDAARRRQSLENDVRSMSAVLSRIASGDLSIVPAPPSDADPAATSLAVVFADTLLALRRLVRQMDSVADQLASSAVDLAGAAEQEVAAMDAQVAAVAETTSTIEQLAATAGTIADTAVRVTQFAGSTRADVDSGAAAVEAATNAMQRIADGVAQLDARTDALTERITRIAKTTHVIDELARQTSILAVNASIEAARAGDHGHGFTTVANEVSTLAGRAREATSRIDAIVTDLTAEAAATAAASHDGYLAVAEGAALQEDVVAALARITAMVDRTTDAAREITEATRQQRWASDAVVQAMSTVASAGERYRGGSRRHAEAAARLRDLAENLRTALGRFRVSSDGSRVDGHGRVG